MRARAYAVRCTKSIAKEMTRYEGNPILESRDHKTSDLTDEFMDYDTWVFIVLGIPNIKRWMSFGIKLVQLTKDLVDWDTSTVMMDQWEYADEATAKEWAERCRVDYADYFREPVFKKLS